MKAYITTEKVQHPHQAPEWIAKVVTEDDYHHRGYAARSYTTNPHGDIESAKQAAREWIEDSGYTLATVNEVAQ